MEICITVTNNCKLSTEDYRLIILDWDFVSNLDPSNTLAHADEYF